MGTTLLGCIFFYSFLNNVDPLVTQAVIATESNGKPFAVSPDFRDFGLMQIRKKYVPFTKLQLLQSCTNVMVGTEILRNAKEKCKHTLDRTWLLCYNRGVAGGKKVKHPKKDRYYKKIAAILERQ